MCAMNGRIFNLSGKSESTWKVLSRVQPYSSERVSSYLTCFSRKILITVSVAIWTEVQDVRVAVIKTCHASVPTAVTPLDKNGTKKLVGILFSGNPILFMASLRLADDGQKLASGSFQALNRIAPSFI